MFLYVNKGWGYGDAKPDHYFPALNYRLTERTVFRVDHTWFFAEAEGDESRFTISFATFF